MNLIWFTVNGYKRFASKTKMNVDGKVVAIVGPNEAGKSSFLKALIHLNERSPFIKNGSSQELSRSVSIPDEQTIIEAQFLLEDADRQAISHLYGGSSARWITVSKRAGAPTFYVSVTPLPHRNLEPRMMALENLKRLDQSISEASGQIKEAIEDMISVLETDAENLGDHIISKIRNFATMLGGSDLSEFDLASGFIDALNELANYEESESPEQAARNILFNRRPKFLLFTEKERDLKSSYTLDQQTVAIPPPALANLARLAKLDLKKLFEMIGLNDQGQIDHLIDEANAELKVVIKRAWTQSDILVRLKQDGPTLTILVKDVGVPVQIQERSDGLRQFISLLGFLSLEYTERPPILLIDEAETHLHYDAQADLVQMLAKQTLASKVIYTTHSVGCLPEDLGTGVRMICPNAESGTSEIKNHFWVNETPGISPLLFGMGAKTMAFIATRSALIAEGATEHILLPTLLREATGREYLEFQVIPGLAEADGNGIGVLEREAPCTAYFADSDEGGKGVIKKLKKAKIPDERIHQLPPINSNSSVIEDYLSPEIYVKAVNEELRRSHGEAHQLSIEELPETGRPNAVKAWCASKSIGTPNKGAIAYRVLELRHEIPISTESQRNTLKQLYAKICKSFKS